MPIGDSSMRDHLANERTLLAWVRTSLSFSAFAIAIEKFTIFMSYANAAAISPAHASNQRAIALVMLVGAAAIAALGARRTLRWRQNAPPTETPMLTWPLLSAPALAFVVAIGLIAEITLS